MSALDRGARLYTNGDGMSERELRCPVHSEVDWDLWGTWALDRRPVRCPTAVFVQQGDFACLEPCGALLQAEISWRVRQGVPG